MNKVVLIGRLTKQPELKYTQGKGTAVVKVTLAVDKYNAATKQREADFIPVTVWGKSAENLANFCDKGSLIAVSGKITTGSYDKDGQKVYTMEVTADMHEGIKFLDNKKQDTGFTPAQNPFGGNEDYTPVDSDDIPF